VVRFVYPSNSGGNGLCRAVSTNAAGNSLEYDSRAAHARFLAAGCTRKLGRVKKAHPAGNHADCDRDVTARGADDGAGHAVVRVVYERYAFDRQASEFVTSLLVAYSLGMFVYLGRDVLVRVFYALGDGETPFRISIVNIFLNALLDYVLMKFFGAPGLVLATVGVNAISMVALLVILDRRLNGLPIRQWSIPIIGLTGASILAGVGSLLLFDWMQRTFEGENVWLLLLELCVSGCVGLGIFGTISMQFKLPELDLFVSRIRQKFGRR
jgi:putative peptidoglycan lipid II flippase